MCLIILFGIDGVVCLKLGDWEWLEVGMAGSGNAEVGIKVFGIGNLSGAL